MKSLTTKHYYLGKRSLVSILCENILLEMPHFNQLD